MHMLRDEDNAKYRMAIKNTLEFDPEILKRYVNFMNNPDERTAVDQFGKGDKYFGICMLMATLPGLLRASRLVARARGMQDLYLTVWVENHRARRFYDRHGFVEVGKYPYVVGSTVDDDRILRLIL